MALHSIEISTDDLEEVEPEARENAVIEAVKRLFRENKINTKRVVSAIPGDSVIVRYVRLPMMTNDELRGVIRYEAEQYIPFNMDQVVLDFQILGEVQDEGQKKIEVLLVAAKEEIIQQHIRVLQAGGLSSAIIDVDFFAVENAYSASQGGQIDHNEIIALINIGAKLATINILEGGSSRFTRSIFVAGNNLTKEIQREFGLTFAQAEELKRQQASILIETEEVSLTRVPNKEDKSVQIYEAINPVLNKLLGEIRRSFDYFETQSRKKSIAKAVLSGGTARLKNLDRFLSDKLGIPVARMEPFKGVEVAVKGLEPDTIEQSGPGFAVGAGLAGRKVK